MSFNKETYCFELKSAENKEIQSFPSKSSRDNEWSRLLAVVFIYFTFIDLVQASSDSRCQPFDYRSCRFGGECTSVSTYFLGIDFRPAEYRCRCRDINPMDYGVDLVCGFDGERYE